MNVFTTDHPMTLQSERDFSRLRKWLLVAVLSYPLWLVLLGPIYGLAGRGLLNFLPEPAVRAAFVPAAPFLLSGPHSMYARYLDWWYHDPNEAETTW